MSSQDDKTEEATEHKKRETRREGNVPKSKDLAAAMLFVAGIMLLRYLGPWMGWKIKGFFERMITVDMPLLDVPEKREIIPYAVDWIMWLCVIVGPFLLLLAFAAYLVHLYQVGWLITTKPLGIKLNKLNPIAGFKRIFSLSNIVMLVMNLAKVALIMGVAWSTVVGEVQNVVGMLEMEVPGMLVYSTDKVLALALKLAILLGFLGYIDFVYQKYKHRKNIRMSKQEVKQEYKQQEGDPLIKNKRRQKQMELAQSRMMQEVPQAEVVVRNPTHYAVAIRYKQDSMDAPVVVAKGKDKFALRIIDAAVQHRVPVVENKPLAQALYKKVEVGDRIPEEMFTVVAEILASVMTEEKKRQMMRAMNPAAAYSY